MIKLTGYEALISRFFDPLMLNRDSLLKDIQSQFLIRLQTTSEPYFCQLCQKIHTVGDLYTQHVDSAEYFPSRIKLPLHSPDNVSHEEIVGIYYTRNGNYLQALKSGVQLDLRPEPHNRHDSYAVSVWHDEHKLGYIPRGPNRRVFSAINHEEVTCLLGRYSPSYYSDHEYRRYYSRYDTDSEFSPERATITIHIFDPNKLQRIFTGLLELIEYTPQIPSLQGQIVDALKILGYRALRLLEARLDTMNPIVRQIYLAVSNHYKISLKNTEFAIIL